MQAIYFPFTYISNPEVVALSACFERIKVYQPSCQHPSEQMQEWAESGILDLHIPIRGDEKKLASILGEFRQWANTHEGSVMTFFKTHGDKIPFFEENSISQIATDIRNEINNKPQQKSDSLFNARIFLQIAQEFDAQRDELYQDLQNCDRMHQALLEGLKGEETHLLEKNEIIKTDNPNDYMIKERVEAWATLMLHVQGVSGLFITANRSAFEYLLENAPEAQMALYLDAIPMGKNGEQEMLKWQAGLIEHLDMLSKKRLPLSGAPGIATPECKENDSQGSLRLYLVPGNTPYQFFSRFVKNTSLEAADINHENIFQNTLFGLVES